MKIINATQGVVLAQKAAMADTMFSRMRGLLNRASLHPEEALLITHCRSIHMFFMRFSIDAVFVDREHRVVGLVKRIRPFCLSPYFRKAFSVVELPEGTIEKTKTGMGDQLRIEK
jgi:uncharacterized membrane protein (UPF0127 family)